MEENDSNSIYQHSPSYVISAGTQVVLRGNKTVVGSDRFKKAGSVGFVLESPDRVDGLYVIEFADGSTVSATFSELSLRRREIDSKLEASDHAQLEEYIIYRCVVGSRAFGLANENSDDDIRGIYLPPASRHWSLYALPGQLEKHDDENDAVFWELEKYVRLSLKANPNVLETLWTPLVLQTNEVASELRAIRSCFLSKHLYKTYSGYVLSQFRRMKKKYDTTGSYKPKHAMHLIRLLYSGIHAVTEGEILIDVGTHRDELLTIREGNLAFDEVRKRALALDQEFQMAFAKTNLPNQPDFETVNDFVIRSRRSVAND